MLAAIDDEIAEYYVRKVDVPLWKHLGMSPRDWTTFLFSPKKWAINYVIKLHGPPNDESEDK